MPPKRSQQALLNLVDYQPKRSLKALINNINIHQTFWREHGLGEMFVMVEGGTDEELWEKFTSKEVCELFVADGKYNITSALDITNNRGLTGVAGIVDADYELIRESEILRQDNLLYDECYPNAELMILDSAALTDALKTKFYREDDPDIQKLADLLKTEAERLAMEVGYFRLLNELQCYGISFKEFWKGRRDNFDEFVDVEDIDKIQFRQDCFAKQLAIFHNAGRKREDDKWLEHGELLEGVAQLKQVEKFKTPNIRLCQGHDTVAIIAYLLPKMFKSVFGSNLPSDFNEFRDRLKLEQKLRNKYRKEDFVTTTLCDSIKNWESANKPYKILKPEI